MGSRASQRLCRVHDFAFRSGQGLASLVLASRNTADHRGRRRLHGALPTQNARVAAQPRGGTRGRSQCPTWRARRARARLFRRWGGRPTHRILLATFTRWRANNWTRSASQWPARSISRRMRRPALMLRSAIFKLPAKAPFADRWPPQSHSRSHRAHSVDRLLNTTGRVFTTVQSRKIPRSMALSTATYIAPRRSCGLQKWQVCRSADLRRLSCFAILGPLDEFTRQQSALRNGGSLKQRRMIAVAIAATIFRNSVPCKEGPC